ncbi:MAG: hypothetical protein L6420_09935 [Elusimicrobia bacterium]|nr:hypothetical protein [Elusimicrobiota bacterium]
MKILITAGGTREYIDGARFIGNISTGKTACAMADFLAKEHDIIYLCSEAAKLPKNKKIKIKKFISFKDLNNSIKNILGNKRIDALIHSAAVGDYSIRLLKSGGKKIELKKTKKISSKNKDLTIILKRNFKIIDRVKTYSKNKKIKLVGFKLTSGAAKMEIKKAVLNLKTADIVAHNDLKEMRKTHPFHIYSGGDNISTASNAAKLASKLNDLLRLKGENHATSS